MNVNLSRTLSTWLQPVAGISPVMFYLRCLKVVVQLVASYWFFNQVSPFFYQQF